MEPLILPQKDLWAGFTGTREGLTKQQQLLLSDLLITLRPRQVQHGDCLGADATVHYMALGLGMQVAIRPPVEQFRRAFCDQSSPNVYVFPPKPFLTRNHDIVDHTQYLIACPNTPKSLLRSGTWATIRYAMKNGKVTYIAYPDGSLDRLEPVG